MTVSETLDANTALHTIAIVSGKGGSGKTLLATAIMQAFDASGAGSLLVDADLGTGGLSYFLGLRQVYGISEGFADLLSLVSMGPVDYTFREIRGTRDGHLLPIGSHEQTIEDATETYREFIPAVFNFIKERARATDLKVVIVDCRGGIDRDSLAVCQQVDSILLIVETDAASIQTTQYLVNVLSKSGLNRKVRGFIINKAFSDPSQLAAAGTSLFRASYLGAVPFDFETTRNFIYGQLPALESALSTQVSHAVSKIFPVRPRGLIWSDRDFASLSLRDPDSVRGGMVAAGLLVMGLYIEIATYIFELPLPYYGPGSAQAFRFGMILSIIVGILGCLDKPRRLIGRVVRVYVEALANIVRVLSLSGSSRNRKRDIG